MPMTKQEADAHLTRAIDEIPEARRRRESKDTHHSKPSVSLQRICYGIGRTPMGSPAERYKAGRSWAVGRLIASQRGLF